MLLACASCHDASLLTSACTVAAQVVTVTDGGHNISESEAFGGGAARAQELVPLPSAHTTNALLLRMEQNKRRKEAMERKKAEEELQKAALDGDGESDLCSPSQAINNHFEWVRAPAHTHALATLPSEPVPSHA